jgi:hypothetical protein
MLRGKIIGICLLILMTGFCLNLTFTLYAEEYCEDAVPISTSPGNADYCKMNPFEFDPDNPAVIECGAENAITLSVIGGLPPLDWEVSGNGYSLEETEDERTYILSCTGDT